MKHCIKCKKLKGDTKFHLNRTRPDGLQDYCKKCRQIYDRECYAIKLKQLDINDEEGELWKDVRGYKGLYKVSNYGRVKRYLRTYGKWRLVRGCEYRGWIEIVLKKKQVRKKVMLHRLVAEHFLERSDNIYVAARDGDLTNCVSSNLYWTTKLQNKRKYESRINVAQRESIRRLLSHGATGRTVAVMFNISPSYVTKIKQGG